MGFRSSDDLSRHIKNAHETRNMPGFSIGAINLTTLPREDQLELLNDAMANGQLDTVRNLVSESVLAMSPETAIASAGWHSPPDILSWLLNHNYKRPLLPQGGRIGDYTYTEIALHAAIEGENFPNIKLLLSRGADLMSRYKLLEHGDDAREEPPSGVFRALRRWNGTLMKFLVEDCGATIPRTGYDRNDDVSTIFFAKHLSDSTLEDVRRRFSAIKPYIIGPEAYTLAPYYAVQARSPALVRISLENGGDPNKSPGNDHPPLYACFIKSGHRLEIAEILLEYKADPNPTNGRSSALELVVRSNFKSQSTRISCAELLLRHGADPNFGPRIEPLYDAVKGGRSEIVKLLLQHGADPNPTRPRRMKGLAGMRKIEKYFGIPWDDIVRKIQAGESVERQGK